jgi:deoxyribodipyrimidine photo-lyase
MLTNVMWFRRDLRLADNPALLAAAASADSVVPVFVLDPALWGCSGAPRQAYLLRSLRELDEQLSGSLVIRHGDPAAEVLAVAQAADAAEVHCAADYGPYGAGRDERVEKALAEAGVTLIRTGSAYAVAPGRVLKSDRTPFRVFTAFSRGWAEHGWRAPAGNAGGGTGAGHAGAGNAGGGTGAGHAGAGNAGGAAGAGKTRGRAADGRNADGGAGATGNSGCLNFRKVPGGVELPAEPVLTGLTLPAAGESAAAERWREFRDTALKHYARDRDRPDLMGTSKLSVSLKFGELHPRTLLADLAKLSGDGPAVFRTELCWREFYADVLWHHPESARKSLNPVNEVEYDTGRDADFEAWVTGRTGYPIVDAAMRQLRTEGWMHNRMRMVTASFLVKDLHLPWWRGARYFLSQLLDGDLASNQHGWQWVAGTGTDAAPYHRVFNPTLQGTRFDPDGDYVRRYVEELRGIPGAAVHEPWKYRGGKPASYPDRILDHAVERVETLRRYAEARGRSA